MISIHDAVKKVPMDDSAPSFYEKVQPAPPIAIFKLTADYNADTNPNKVNLGVGAFRTSEGKPFVLPVVREVEKVIANDATLTKEYLPISGHKVLTELVQKLQLGENHRVLEENRTVAVQTISGTGAIRMVADFLIRHHAQREKTAVYVSDPTWPNHVGLFKSAGFTDIRKYRYWDPKRMGLDFEALVEDLSNAPFKSIFILHSCAHNPTGCDLTREQWTELAKIASERQAFCLFDMAYQGFATGDPEVDGWAPRMFAECGFEMACCTSFAKNFGLYQERIGVLTLISKKADYIPAIKSQLEIIIRTGYSNPPAHGALIVATILNNPHYRSMWRENLSYMSDRIKMMRTLLKQELDKCGCPGKWDHILSQIGMFSFTGLSEKQSEWLVQERSIYLTKNGRINMCGITPANVQYVAGSMKESFSI